MDDRQREQIGRIIGLASTSGRSALAMALQRVYNEHSQAGRLASGATVVAAVAEIQRATNLLLTELVTKTAAVSRTPAAFEEVASGMGRWLRVCEDELTEVVRTASGLRLQGASPVSSGLGERELQKVKDEVEQRLEVERYDFETPAGVPADPPPSPKGRTGGRPPAEFWDDMWASIAAQLYDGTLQPKTQADIERAMAEWITAAGHDAASSTIRGRARRLADRLEL
jgi:hypothetical protein